MRFPIVPIFVLTFVFSTCTDSFRFTRFFLPTTSEQRDLNPHTLVPKASGLPISQCPDTVLLFALFGASQRYNNICYHTPRGQQPALHLNGGIWTHNFYIPNVAVYQIDLHPDSVICTCQCSPLEIMTLFFAFMNPNHMLCFICCERHIIYFFMPVVGFEPTVYALREHCHTAWLHRLIWYSLSYCINVSDGTWTRIVTIKSRVPNR